MTLNIPILEIIKEAGHDGSDIIFPHLEEPMCRKGFHSQELVKIAWRHRFAITPIELFPRILSNDRTLTEFVWETSDTMVWARFIDFANRTIGIVEGRGINCDHAVHNSHGILYDPDPSGDIYQLCPIECKKRNFYPTRMWIFTRHGL